MGTAHTVLARMRKGKARRMPMTKTATATATTGLAYLREISQHRSKRTTV